MAAKRKNTSKQERKDAVFRVLDPSVPRTVVIRFEPPRVDPRTGVAIAGTTRVLDQRPLGAFVIRADDPDYDEAVEALRKLAKRYPLAEVNSLDEAQEPVEHKPIERPQDKVEEAAQSEVLRSPDAVEIPEIE